MKTPKELADLKEEVETMRRKLAELTDEELAEVTGGCLYDRGILPIPIDSAKPGTQHSSDTLHPVFDKSDV